jgi:hypothetical protein
MTEAEWLGCDDPEAMLNFLQAKARDRKLRLFGCAAVRVIWPRLGEELPSAVEVAEKYAEGTVSKAALRRARHAVRDKRHGLEGASLEASTLWAAYWLAETVATLNAYGSVVAELNRLSSDTLPLVAPDWLAACDGLRDIFGNPFRPAAFSPQWRTDTALSLARQMYDSRDFGAMPILADALQDAGCDNNDILAHCRGPGPHVRGCWVVDLVLGKE